MKSLFIMTASLVGLVVAVGCGGDDYAQSNEQQDPAPSKNSIATKPTSSSQGELDSDRLDNWHQWRGPNANGLAPKGNPPLQWDEETNVKWKVEIPGTGSATPIVWGNQLFLLTAVKTNQKPNTVAQPADTNGDRSGGGGSQRGRFRMSTPTPTTFYEFVILCLDRETGKTIWQKVAHKEVPHEGHHPSHGYASASPTTDGQYLYASFGSRGLFCYNLQGDLQWKRDLGNMRTRIGFGEGTSPVLHGNSLIVNWDHEGDSFIACLDAKTGKDKWRVPRDESTTWATPLVVEHDGVTQVVTNARNRTRSYDLATGKLIWECGGQAGNPIPSPVTLDGTVYCMTGFRGFAMHAIPLSAKGDITDSEKMAWQRSDAAPYVASPLLYDDLLYFTKERTGIFFCLNAKSGKVNYSNKRLPGINMLYASLAGAAGRIYIAGRDGKTVVLKHGLEYEVLATNELDEGIDASPVIVGPQLFLRGQKHLYCIATD
jgi:outer membrane protein assembly factor BamB